MKTKLFFVITMIGFLSNAQTISIVGTGVNGWPDNMVGPEITLSTLDGITYTKTNLTVNNGEVKFRQDLAWTNNWGGGTFPNGQGVLNSATNIATTAGTYNVTFNRSNGTYSFITSFPTVGLIGPAVNAILGYLGPEVPFYTEDGENYTLSGFYYNGGGGYFKINSGSNSYGSTSFPTGTAVNGGPPLSIPGGEFTCKYNINTQNYSFGFPSVGILGTALNGFENPDTDLQTTNGFSYTISELPLSAGDLKFRLDNRWVKNWGSSAFPIGTGLQDGANIPITTAGNYNVIFDRTNGNYEFQLVLNTNDFDYKLFQVYPNPTDNSWEILSKNKIEKIELLDILGKIIFTLQPRGNTATLDASEFSKGLYFVKISDDKNTATLKLFKK